MDAVVWQVISFVGYTLGAVFLVVAITLFFKMNIRAIIGDLSGKTAARKIQEIRERNLMTGNHRYKPAAFQLDRAILTDPSDIAGNRQGRKVGKTAQAIAHASKRLDLKAKTAETLHAVNEIAISEPTTVLFSESGLTEVLPVNTELLDQRTRVFNDLQVHENATEVLGIDDGTEILSQTTMLYPTEELEEHEKVIPTVDFKMVKDIKIVHTNETIDS